MQSGMLILQCANKFKIHGKSEELKNMFQKVVLLNHFTVPASKKLNKGFIKLTFL